VNKKVNSFSFVDNINSLMTQFVISFQCHSSSFKENPSHLSYFSVWQMTHQKLSQKHGFLWRTILSIDTCLKVKHLCSTLYIIKCSLTKAEKYFLELLCTCVVHIILYAQHLVHLISKSSN